MPNIKSALKRDQLAKKQAIRNKAEKSLMRTNLKKFQAAVAEGNREAADSAYKVAVKTVDHAASKNLIHKNKAARQKSQLTIKLNNMAQ